MKKYYDIVLDNEGNAVLSATITVTDNSGGSVSTIYADDGVTAKANPFTASSVDGAYSFYAANGRYDITITKTGFTTEQLTDIVLYDPVDSSSKLQSSYIVATKAEAEALTPVDGRKVFITSDDGGEFTMKTGGTAGDYNDDGGSYCGTKFTAGDGSSGFLRDYDGAINVKWFGATGDGVTDDTAAIQTWINDLSNNHRTGYAPAGVYNFTKLYLQYDATNNPGFNSTESERGRFKIVGEGACQSANVTNSEKLGAVLNCTETTGDAVVAEVLGADSTVYPHRSITLERLTIWGNTSGNIVKIQGGQGWQYNDLTVVNENQAGTGMNLIDIDQIGMRNVIVQSDDTGTYQGGGQGIILTNIDVDGSEHDINKVLIKGWEDALTIGELPNAATSDKTNQSFLANISTNNCRYGLKLQGDTNGLTFAGCNFRGADKGVIVRGLCRNAAFMGGAMSSGVSGGTPAYALQIGDSTYTAAQNNIDNLRVNGQFFNAISAHGVYVLGGSNGANLSNLDITRNRFNGNNAGAEMWYFDGNPNGGRYGDNEYNGTFNALYETAGAATTPDVTALEWQQDEGSLYPNMRKATNVYTVASANVASAATIDLEVAEFHTITGAVNINQINWNGGNPPLYTTVKLKFNAATNLLSTLGGGTGTGNIDIHSGDHAVVGNQIVTLCFLGGGWKLED